MKLILLNSLALLFATAHALPQTPALAEPTLNDDAICYTPLAGTGCTDQIPEKSALEKAVRKKCIRSCNPYPGWKLGKNQWQCVIAPGDTNGTIYCVL
ncbi:hypothetical protein P3342_004850 [Pyrenophora teres f. teres]|uniref:Uncharacterized protein n=1 Tax=Pyrenophora teres f. teres TaxID=97479 RepID=A0A6S6VUA8_9PLEO|nr:hypothetical protein HRS9139_01033 [Pyrenophora teres f. teres]CAA9959603.1 hypothetical protein PTMSG1_03020 [Pyrenophora teres f. maculata]KAE8848608.1 hypothetical protein PTNB85_02451 [Pyrenophora teres f. teres]KAE8853221.1 hypothetical protein HRS9122_00213 [Pyrenophora teres f. teres]KAE8868533.1 hypothetical protein PTNB29_02444 [Pyrenophora teres f. teres]